MELVAFLVILFIINFIFNWMKVFFFMWGASMKGSSFKMTFAYMLGKNELKDLMEKR